VDAYALSTASFTVPPIGSTVQVDFSNATWVVVGEMLWVDQAGGGVGQGGTMQVTAINGNVVTLLNLSVGGVQVADATQDGLLRKVSGNTTDFIDGTNNSQPFLPLVKTVPLDTLASPTDNTSLNVSTSAHGLMSKLPNTGKAYFCDNGSWALPGNYYGTDTANATAYAVTVDSDFVLEPGVVVWVAPTLTCNANPTLNVNGTGAKNIVTRANLQLSAQDIQVNRAFGVMYDGASWRVITPLQRWYNATNPANPTIDCAGYDAVVVCATYTSATGAGFSLPHLARGVPVTLDFQNSTGAAMSWYVNASDPAGNGLQGWFVWCNTPAGVPATQQINSGASPLPAVTNGYRFTASGGIMEGYLFLK
jgi:hypothetical protein